MTEHDRYPDFDDIQIPVLWTVRLRRQTFLKISTLWAASMIGAFMIGRISAPLKEEDDNKEKKRPDFYQPFFDQDANEIATQKGINAGSFFVVSAELMGNLKAYKEEDELLPIFPPAVYQYKDLIYELADNYHVPPNIVAAIISIESAGLHTAVSSVGAQGLMQVMPFHFEANGIFEQTQMREPRSNIEYGISIFQDNLTRAYKTLDQPLPETAYYVRALMGYNGGNKALELPLPTIENINQGLVVGVDTVEEETAFYGDFLIRYFVTAEIAAGLRQKGFSDREIIEKLQSSEIDALAYTLEGIRHETGDYSYAFYNQIINVFTEGNIEEIKSRKLTTDQKTLLIQKYREYFESSDNKLPFTASPATVIWIRLGGRGLLEKDNGYNQNPYAWLAINSRRDN